jgi:hypothetical protein
VLWAAYLTAVGAGLSLVFFLGGGRGAPPRLALLPPILFAAAVGAWELSVPRSANIRIDLLFIIPALGVVEGFFGIGFAIHARRLQEQRLPSTLSAIAAAICLGASGFVAAAWIASSYQVAHSIDRSQRGHQWAFEAAFRDDATQRRVFGELDGDPDGWAGYYVPESPDTYPRRLVIGADGRYWTFWQDDYMKSGERAADSREPERFDGKEGPRGIGVDELHLVKAPGAGFTLNRKFGGKDYAYAYRREAPPRFPRPAASTDRVKYRGVFSGGIGSATHLRVAQLWIWEAEGKLWGKYLWQGLTPGYENRIVAQRDAAIDCNGAGCLEITVRVEDERPAVLKWLSTDTLELQTYDDRGRKIVLERGEMVPGFLYDLAPLAAVDENREWLRAIPGDVAWTPPITQEVR